MKPAPKKGSGFSSFLMGVILALSILFVFYIWNKRSTEQEATRKAQAMPNTITGRCNTPGGDCPETLRQ